MATTTLELYLSSTIWVLLKVVLLCLKLDDGVFFKGLHKQIIKFFDMNFSKLLEIRLFQLHYIILRNSFNSIFSPVQKKSHSRGNFVLSATRYRRHELCIKFSGLALLCDN